MSSRACPPTNVDMPSSIQPYLSPLFFPPPLLSPLYARACVRACEWFTREAKQSRLACRHALVALLTHPPPLQRNYIHDFHAKFPRRGLPGTEKSWQFRDAIMTKRKISWGEGISKERLFLEFRECNTRVRGLFEMSSMVYLKSNGYNDVDYKEA